MDLGAARELERGSGLKVGMVLETGTGTSVERESAREPEIPMAILLEMDMDMETEVDAEHTVGLELDNITNLTKGTQ
jgi:hypothetical protein